MKKFQFIPVALLLCAGLLLTFCKKTPDDSFNEPAYTGWAVGDADQGYGTILHTANDGMSWDRQGSASFQAGANFRDVSVMNTREVWVVGDTVDGYGSVWHTTDGGQSWARMGDTILFGQRSINAVWAKSGKRVWIAGDKSTLVYTDNGGVSWTPVAVDSLSSVRFTAISGDSTTAVWVVGNSIDTLGVETGVVILHSANGGTSFTQQSLMPGFTAHVYDISVVNDSTAWIAAGNWLFVTYNAGSSWQQAYTTLSGDFHSVCADKFGNVWAGGEIGILHHRFAGLWTAMNPQGVRYTLNGITLADSNRVWVTGYKPDLSPRGTVLYTHTTGRSWFIEGSTSVAGMRRVSFANGVK